VARVTDLGPMLRLHLMTPAGESLLWVAPRDAAPVPGSRVTLWPRHLHVFRDGVHLDRIEPERLTVAREVLP
jgi:hypothetical protein